MYFRHPVAFAMAEMAPAAVGESAGGDQSSSFDVTIRTDFPETWIWQLTQVGLVKGVCGLLLLFFYLFF